MPDPGQLDRAREQVHEAHDLLDDMGVARQEIGDLSLSPPRWLTLKERIERLASGVPAPERQAEADTDAARRLMGVPPGKELDDAD